MQSLPQQACEACGEMVAAVRGMLERVKGAKRLGDLEAMRIELCAVQMELGSLLTKSLQVEAHVCAAVVTMGTRHCEAREPEGCTAERG